MKGQNQGVQWKRPQLSLKIQNTDEEEEEKHIKSNKQSTQSSQQNIQVQQEKPQSQKQQKKFEKQELQLNESVRTLDIGTMSCELNQEGLKVMREDFEIGKSGMRNISTGQIIVGNLMKEDLEMKEVIGNGASGYVYKAIHKPTGKVLALKSINAFDKPKRHQLINDLRALHKNTCPFLVEFCGALYEEGAVKVALEYMDMGSLKSLIKLASKDPERNPQVPLIPDPIMSKITQQILAGLCYLNICKKQLHRDIKPDNVLINSSGFVKLTDFGITIQLDETGGLAKSFVGTMTYMSPERMEGETYSAKGDIWSLGIILVEMMTGVYPYPETKGFLEMLEQIKYGDSPNVPNTQYYSQELRDFIDECLKKEPDERASPISLLAHPWILKYTQSEANIAGYLKKLISFKDL